MFETIILPIVTLFVGGGLATFLTLKATKRTANANADQAEVQTRADEFHLLKEQIELNQQQNLDLTKASNDLTQLNLELTEHIKDKARKYAEQTEILRQAQAKLLAAESEQIKLTAEIGDLKVQLAHKRCDTLSCPFRQPPNVHTPPKPDMTEAEYHMAAEKKPKAKKTKSAKTQTTQV